MDFIAEEVALVDDSVLGGVVAIGIVAEEVVVVDDSIIDGVVVAFKIVVDLDVEVVNDSDDKELVSSFVTAEVSFLTASVAAGVDVVNTSLVVGAVVVSIAVWDDDNESVTIEVVAEIVNSAAKEIVVDIEGDAESIFVVCTSGEAVVDWSEAIGSVINTASFLEDGRAAKLDASDEFTDLFVVVSTDVLLVTVLEIVASEADSAGNWRDVIESDINELEDESVNKVKDILIEGDTFAIDTVTLAVSLFAAFM